MCVILQAARKSIVARREVLTAMRNNPAGFFIAELLPGGKRRKLRTLSKGDVVDFFDRASDYSELVMHFRVPSHGTTALDNVHGWSSDRILFCHNRTLFELEPSMDEDQWSGTDSEYFFRKVFIPLYRKFGGFGKAYRNGKLCPVLDRVVRGICGDYNKFLFVMPDNMVLRYGEWEGNDESRPGFYASNLSYREDFRKDDASQGSLGLLARFLNFLRRLFGLHREEP